MRRWSRSGLGRGLEFVGSQFSALLVDVRFGVWELLWQWEEAEWIFATTAEGNGGMLCQCWRDTAGNLVQQAAVGVGERSARMLSPHDNSGAHAVARANRRH